MSAGALETGPKARGVYSAPPDPLAGFQGTLRGRRGIDRRED